MVLTVATFLVMLNLSGERLKPSVLKTMSPVFFSPSGWSARITGSSFFLLLKKWISQLFALLRSTGGPVGGTRHAALWVSFPLESRLWTKHRRLVGYCWRCS